MGDRSSGGAPAGEMSGGMGTGVGYDPRTSIFTPEGRLYLVECAEHALNNAAMSADCISAKDCVSIGLTIKKMQDKLRNLTNQNTTKIPHSPIGKNASEILGQQLRQGRQQWEQQRRWWGAGLGGKRSFGSRRENGRGGVSGRKSWGGCGR